VNQTFLEDWMKIKAVIWDIGGVIMRTEDLGPRDQLAADLGMTRAYLNDLVWGGEQGTRAQFGEINQNELWEYVRSELKLGPDEYPDLQERFFGGDVLDTELVDFIRSLKPRFKIGIISNAWSELSAALNNWGIADAFDVVVGSGDEGFMKPDPRIYQIALERLSVQPQEAIFVDDFIENISGARDLGINAVHFQSREQALRELKSFLNV
jgi:epoxide hydrolase-like predicted phosphatase